MSSLRHRMQDWRRYNPNHWTGRGHGVALTQCHRYRKWLWQRWRRRRRWCAASSFDMASCRPGRFRFGYQHCIGNRQRNLGHFPRPLSSCLFISLCFAFSCIYGWAVRSLLLVSVWIDNLYIVSMLHVQSRGTYLCILRRNSLGSSSITAFTFCQLPALGSARRH